MFRKSTPVSVCESAKPLGRVKINKEKNLEVEEMKSATSECLKEASGAGDGAGGAASPGECRRCRCGARGGGFGVQVDLSSFFSDERSCCWVWVVARRPVQWLAARLAARLRLAHVCPAGVALLAPRGLLHPRDPLALLCPGDTVRVVPVQSCSSLFESDEDPFRTAYTDCCHKCVQACNDETCPEGNDTECIYEEVDCCNMDTVTSGKKSGGGGGGYWPNYSRGVAARPATRSAHCSPSPSRLQAVKQRALDLLSRYEHSLSPAPAPAPRERSRSRSRSPLAPAAPACPRAGRPRRRRARRRPRLPVSPPAAAVSQPATHAPDAAPSSPEAVGATTPQVDAAAARVSGGGERAGSVARNAAARALPPPPARAPRRVRALSRPAAPAPAPP